MVRPQNSGYGEAGASHVKKAVRGFVAPSGSPRDDIDENSYTLRQRARMLYMAAPIAASAIKTNRTNVIGVGLKLKSRIDREALGMTPEQAEAWQNNAEREFALWAENRRACDATGMNNFYGLQQLALMSWLLSGDCIGVIRQQRPTPLMPYSTRVYLVESDRVRTPHFGAGGSPRMTVGTNPDNGNRIFDGVEIDRSGAVVAYHICSTYPYESTIQKEEWTRVQAWQPNTGLPNVIHVMDSERPDQYRGVTYLAQVIEPLLQVRRYTESEIMAAMIESFFAAWVKTTSDSGENPFNETDPTPEGEVKGPNDYSMGPGQINIMGPDEDVTFSEPKRPGGHFPAFVNAVATQIGAALEVPADLLLKAFNASYSASRAALLEAWKAFKMRRQWMSDDFCKPIYEVWMTEAVARGRLSAPGFFTDPVIRAAYLGSEWLGPSQGQLDPVKEITAEILACSEGFSTHEQSTVKLNGGKWDSNIEQLQRETEKLGGKDPDPHQDGLKKKYRTGTAGDSDLVNQVVTEQVRMAVGGKQE